MFAIVVWSICTALTPTAAELGNVQIISMRVLLGAGEGEKLLRSECSVFYFDSSYQPLLCHFSADYLFIHKLTNLFVH